MRHSAQARVRVLLFAEFAFSDSEQLELRALVFPQKGAFLNRGSTGSQQSGKDRPRVLDGPGP